MPMMIEWTQDIKAERGAGMEITYGYVDLAPYGRALVAQSKRGTCFFGFPQKGTEAKAEAKMRAYFPQARFESRDVMTFGDRIDMHGTSHQIATWKELMKIPQGQTVSYQSLAAKLGNPSAARAIGNAVAANPVCLFIPCHRVIAANGAIHHYAWGTDIKRQILRVEAAI